MSAHSNSPLASPSRRRKLNPQTKPISAGSMSNRDEGSDTKRGRQSSARFQVKELGRETWSDFERMVEKHNGVWGGWWDTWLWQDGRRSARLENYMLLRRPRPQARGSCESRTGRRTPVHRSQGRRDS